MTASLTVWWDGQDVGLLSLDRHGEMRFAYSETWLADETAPPVSFSLPKCQQPFSRREARPFFEGLLPEEEQREAIAAALGISKGNEFRLLESLGGEVAGALTLWPTGEVLPNTLDAKANTPLSETDLIALLDRLPKRPFLAGERYTMADICAQSFLEFGGALLDLEIPKECEQLSAWYERVRARSAASRYS